MSEVQSQNFSSFRKYRKPSYDDNIYLERPEDRIPDYYCLAVEQIDYAPDEGSWKFCYNVAGQGTTHHGTGRCAIHGGSLIDGSESLNNPYGDISDARLQVLLSKFLSERDPLNLHPVLALSKALTQMWLEDWKTITDAMIAWYASFHPKRRGLHDYPLYHVGVIHYLFSEKIEEGKINELLRLDADELNEELDKAAERWKDQWENNGRTRNGTMTRIADLFVEKPIKMPNYSAGIKHLQLIERIASRLMEHEKDAWLSSEGSTMLIKDLGAICRAAIPRFLRQRGILLKEVEIQPLLEDVSYAFMLSLEQLDAGRFFRKETTKALEQWLTSQREEMTLEAENSGASL